jgi:hypothetical protein
MTTSASKNPPGKTKPLNPRLATSSDPRRPIWAMNSSAYGARPCARSGRVYEVIGSLDDRSG